MHNVSIASAIRSFYCICKVSYFSLHSEVISYIFLFDVSTVFIFRLLKWVTIICQQKKQI